MFLWLCRMSCEHKCLSSLHPVIMHVWKLTNYICMQAVPNGENLLLDMSCTGKDRASNLASILHMCLTPWKIASYIFFLTVLNLLLCRGLCIWKLSKKKIKISGGPVSSLMLRAQMTSLKGPCQQLKQYARKQSKNYSTIEFNSVEIREHLMTES